MCTLYCISKDDFLIIGKNYDVTVPCYGLMFWNPAGIEKKALIKPPDEPALWYSKYGSITFNQVGRDFPSSGMNEKGVVVEQTTLWNTIYPNKDDRKAIKELQLIQYLLDVCSSVSEAVEVLKTVRVSQEMSKLQYVIADNEGNISLVEFIMGETVIYSNDEFYYKVITNDMYDTSVDYLKTHHEFGGIKSIGKSSYSLDRFVVTVDAINRKGSSYSRSFSFDLLNLSKNNDTQWQILYDLKHLKIKWKIVNKEVANEIDLSEFVQMRNCLTVELDTMDKDNYSRDRNMILANHFFKESIYFKAMRVRDNEIAVLVDHPSVK